MFSELWSNLRYRARAIVRRAAVEQELDDELRFHVEREAERYERAGISRHEALRRARLAFGGVEQVKEASRDSRGTVVVESIIQDIKYATRALRQHPAFTLAVVLTLSIGIGANTAIFTLIDALMLRALPVADPARLVIIGDPAGVGGWLARLSADRHPIVCGLRRYSQREYRPVGRVCERRHRRPRCQCSIRAIGLSSNIHEPASSRLTSFRCSA